MTAARRPCLLNCKSEGPPGPIWCSQCGHDPRCCNCDYGREEAAAAPVAATADAAISSALCGGCSCDRGHCEAAVCAVCYDPRQPLHWGVCRRCADQHQPLPTPAEAVGLRAEADLYRRGYGLCGACDISNYLAKCGDSERLEAERDRLLRFCLWLPHYVQAHFAKPQPEAAASLLQTLKSLAGVEVPL